jgi:hypothetical protein
VCFSDLTALSLDPSNRIAQRNIDRLKVLPVAAGEKTVPSIAVSKAPVSIFVEETGTTGFAYLTDLADPRQLAQVNPGDSVELTPEGSRLVAISNGVRIGIVEPRVAARLLKLMADGNKYAAGVTSLGDKDVCSSAPATSWRGAPPAPPRSPSRGRAARSSATCWPGTARAAGWPVRP